MKNFVKNLSDGGLSEDVYAFMKQALDEYVNKEKMAVLDKVEEFLNLHLFNSELYENGQFIPDEIIAIKYKTVRDLLDAMREFVK